MEILGLLLVFVLVFLVVSRVARKKKVKAGPSREEAAIETWAKTEVGRLIASKIDIEAADVRATLGGEPDPDVVTRIEKAVSGVEIVYERALGSGGEADVRVEVRFESGDVQKATKRIPWAELPTHVKDEFAKSGAAHVYRPWMFPWAS